jgi:hypothetical protein
MSSAPSDFDLPAIADEAETEIMTIETIEAAELTLNAGESAEATAEFGYYEAELSSLRDAALSLNEKEQTLD